MVNWLPKRFQFAKLYSSNDRKPEKITRPRTQILVLDLSKTINCLPSRLMIAKVQAYKFGKSF